MLKPQFYLKPVSKQSLVELSTLRFPPKSVVTDTLLNDFLNNDWSNEARKFISDNLLANKTQLELSQLPSSEVNFSVLNDSDSRLIAWIDFCQMLDKALKYDKSELAKLTKEVDYMIISGYRSMSESAGSSSISKKMNGVKSKKGLGNYDFKFSAFRGTKLRIDCTYNYFDQRDYAIFNPKTKKITSYSDTAADFVINSLADAGIDTTQLSKLASEIIK